MKHKLTATIPQSDRWSYLWLAVGILFTLFSFGKWVIPLAAWLSTVFLIRFLRTQRVSRGYIAFLPALLVVNAIDAGSLLGFSFILVFVLVGVFLMSLPFLADRLLAPRLRGFIATLVFPLASTGWEFLNMAGSPFGSWGALAYSQYGNLALMQLVSVTGLWGISFLMNWFASVANWAWEQSFNWPTIRRGLALYSGILALVLVFGSARLIFSQPPTNTVRVAGLTAVEVRLLEELMPLVEQDRQAFQQATNEIQERYFEATVREARAGAKIVLWSEAAAVGAGEDERALLERGQEIARQEGIYLAMSLYTIYQDKRPVENKLIIIDPAGKIAMEHVKYGGNLLEGSLAGDGKLRTIETLYGILSGAICWDADFIPNIQQAGRNRTAILLVPAHDWRAIDPLHGQMSVFRAIENGISVFRQADQGLSIATDPFGRVLASQSHFTTSEHVMIAQVPTQGVYTIYSVIGDLFGWLSVVGFVAVAMWAIIRWRRGL